MPAQLSLVAPGARLNPHTPQMIAAAAAARSVIRRSGGTLACAFMAARSSVRGRHPASFELHLACAWWRAQAVAIRTAWPNGRAPHGVRLALLGARP